MDDIYLEIILHICLLYFVLVIIGYLYLNPIATTKMENMFTRIINNDKDATKYCNNIVGMNLQQESIGDEKTRIINNEKVWILISRILVILTILTIVLMYNNKNYKKILQENVIILFFVGIFEIVFFKFIIQSEVLITPEYVKRTAAEKMIKKME